MPGRPGDNEDLRQTFDSLLRDDVLCEHARVLKKSVIPVRKNIDPVLHSGAAHGGLDELEVPGIPVGTDVEHVAFLINHRVGQVFQTGLDHDGRCIRLSGGDDAGFAIFRVSR